MLCTSIKCELIIQILIIFLDKIISLIKYSNLAILVTMKNSTPKSRLLIKNKNKPPISKLDIPEIILSLDDMLTEAYQQLRKQPKKSHILAQSPDVYVLDNKILSDYVHSIYKQYDITDPMSTQQSETLSKCRSRSSSLLKSREFVVTPKKNPNFSIAESHRKTAAKKQSQQKVYSLKNKIKGQLRSEQLSKNSHQRQRKDSNDERMFPIKKRPKRVTVILPRKKSSVKNNTSNLFQSQNYSKDFSNGHSYCLFCEKQLQPTQYIRFHAQSCEAVSQFLKKYPVPQLLTLLDIFRIKGSQLSDQIMMMSHNFKQEAVHIQDQVKTLMKVYQGQDKLNKPTTPIYRYPSDFSLTLKSQREAVQKVYRDSKIIRCYTKIQFYEHVKKVRNQLIRVQELEEEKERQFQEICGKYLGFQCYI